MGMGIVSRISVFISFVSKADHKSNFISQYPCNSTMNPQAQRNHYVMTDPPNELVLSLYDDYCGNCFNCANCFKDAPSGVEFMQCSACNSVQYCSKDCQVAHWKSHKKRCNQSVDTVLLNQPGVTDEQIKVLKKIPGRMHRFMEYFRPLLDFRILPIQFCLMQRKKNRRRFPNSNRYFVNLPFSELQPSSMKPRLRLDDAQISKLSELPTQHKKHMEHGISSNPAGTFVIPFVWNVTFSYRTSDGGTLKGTHSGPGMAAYPYNPLSSIPTDVDDELLSMECKNYIRFVNCLAEGQRLDLFSAIKEKMKANQAGQR
eukprot:scaffold81874_cov50-Cyclotella_meneghiniana.AAC.4